VRFAAQCIIETVTPEGDIPVCAKALAGRLDAVVDETVLHKVMVAQATTDTVVGLFRILRVLRESSASSATSQSL